MRYADAVGGRGRVEFSPAMVAGRALAGLLLLAGLTLPMTAQAQTTVTLVSNTGQGNTADGYLANVDVAQAFDTGSNAAGYNLDSVQIVSSGTHRFSLAVYTTDTNRYPDTLLHSLTNPGTFAQGTLVFTAPENATLDTDTTYTLLLRVNNQVTFGVTGNDAEDGGRAAGWTIADDFDRKLPGGWLSSDSNAALRIAIKGSSANNPATGAPGITGTAQVGQTLTATVGDIADVEGLPDPFLTDADTSFQWIRVDGGDSDILGATASTYTLMGADQGKTIRVKVSFKDNDGYAEGPRTSAATAAVRAAAVTNSPATGAPGITGTAQVGQTLTATVGDIADVEGLPEPFLMDADTSFQWIRVDTDSTEADILGATASSYTLVGADQGKTIRVKVSFKDNDGYAEGPVTSAATAAVRAANTLATGALAITGTAQVGQTLTADTSGIMDANGLTNVSYTYQWIRVDTDSTEADILGATASSYTLMGADQGKTIKVEVSFADDARNPETLTSAATAAVSEAPNTLATGAPGITGTAQVGQTLTATVGNIADVEGLPDPFLMDADTSFQWIRVDTDSTEADILGATASSYTLMGADQGKTIKVKVSFTDDASNSETLTSAAYPTSGTVLPANTAPTSADKVVNTNEDTEYTFSSADFPFTDTDIGASLASVTIVGLPTLGTLTLSGTAIASGVLPQMVTAPELTAGSLKYQPAANLSGPARFTFRVNDGTDDSAGFNTLTIIVASLNDPATGTPGITGTAQVGQTLTATVGDIADVEGLPAPFLTDADTSFQWIRVDGGDSDILGATASTYTLVGADQGKTIRVKVGFKDNDGYAEGPRTSAATAAVRAAAVTNSPATGAPAITGTAQVGQMLTAVTTGIMDADGLTNVSYTYQWTRVDTDSTEADILGATASSYTLVGADQGKTIRVKVSFIDNDGYAEGPLTSAATAAVRAAAVTNSPATGAPAITGTAQVGQTLTAVTTGIMDADGLTNVSYTYQWIRVDGGAETNISGATPSSYTLVGADQGKTIKVKVSFSDDASNVETLTSAATAAVRAAAVTNSPATPAVGAWLARFGRTVGTHVLDAVGTRLRGAPGAESHVTVGGHRLPLEKNTAGEPEATTLGGRVSGRWSPGCGGRCPAARPPGAEPEGRLAALVTGLAGVRAGSAPAGGVDAAGFWADRPAGDPRLGQLQPLHVPALRQVLVGSSFRLNLSGDPRDSATPRLTAWGQFLGTTFDGRDGALTLGGDVLTGTLGVDGEWERWLGGVAAAHSRGDGSYTIAGTGGDRELENALTSIHPYLRYAVNERLDVWGVLGSGRGDVTLKPGNGATLETGTTLVMGALGGRGLLLAAADTGGFQLATRTDAMLTRTTSDAVAGLQATEADAHRLRLVLEGSREVTWPEGRRLTPAVEIGLRHDWGDAETGFGLELGGRVQYADPRLGLTIEAAVRGLLAHEDSDYGEWGASGSVRFAPGPDGQGLALTLSPTWGAASSGVEGLWSRQTAAGLVPQGTRSAPTGRLNAEVSYGVAAPFGTGLLTPYAGTVLADGAARTYRVGTRLELTGGWATGVTLSLEGQRQEPVGPQPVNQGMQFQAAWGF